jgi:glycosyltransferase involved in cell wall biosynthesis
MDFSSRRVSGVPTGHARRVPATDANCGGTPPGPGGHPGGAVGVSAPGTVLVNAGPWLPVPPDGYGGIENVIATLVPPLRRRGVRVVLCAAAGSTLEVDELVQTLPRPMFEHIAEPYNQMMGVAHAHMQGVVATLRRLGDQVDLVHDHLEVVGPGVLGAMGEAAPPVLQTLHWDLRKHPDFYGRFDGGGRIFFNGVSESQLARAPEQLRRQALGAVPLGVDTTRVPFQAEKGDAFLVLGRIAEIKGQDLAAHACRAGGWRLDLAGPVAGVPGPEALRGLLDGRGSPLSGNADVRFYLDRVRPLEDGTRVRWVGSLTGAHKLDVLGRARALLAPVRWDEPGGTAIVEALACGTPVIGLRRGALATLVEHGVTGFLADEPEELVGLLARAGEIDPADCRRAAEERFSAEAMAEAYLALYRTVLERAPRLSTPAPPG